MPSPNRSRAAPNTPFKPWILGGLLIASFQAAGQTAPATAASAVPPISARVLMSTSTTWNGEPLRYPAAPPQITALEIEIAPGAETGWHQHPMPSLAYMVEGELEVRLKDGRSQRLQAGDSFAEVVDTLHNGRNTGGQPARLIVFYLGVAAMPLSVAAPR
jgi:quercetin dioxygenase-like cupin family protein